MLWYDYIIKIQHLQILLTKIKNCVSSSPLTRIFYRSVAHNSSDFNVKNTLPLVFLWILLYYCCRHANVAAMVKY